MIDFAELGRLNYRDQGAFATLDAMLGEVASFVETRTAAEVSTVLAKKIESDPTLADPLKPFLAKFRILALPVLTDQQASAVFASIGSILQDERIGIYERLRARILALPQTRREVFASQVLAALKSSTDKLGPSGTVGTWVTLFEQSGGKPEDFFKKPEFVGLDDATDHALRHLIHVVTLLRAPDQHVGTAVQRTVTAPPVAPVNLPVAPIAPPMAPTPPPAPVTPPPPIRRVEPAPMPAPPPVSEPSMAAVIARLHQTEQQAVAEPPTVAHLTPDDEQEIEGHTARLGAIDAGPNVHDSLGETIEKMIVEMKLDFPEDNLRRRFITVMTSRLKDIRNSNETVELLTRAPKVGGLGLDRQLAEQIVAQASNVAAGFRDVSEVRRMAERQKELQQAPMPKPPKVPAALPSPVAPVPARPPVSVPVQPTVPPPSFTPSASMRPPVSQAPGAFRNDIMPSSTMSPASMRGAANDRPTVSDIRGTSRLTGPIEELRQMTVADYRRLGPDPVSVIRRVYEKIQRLGKESFTKRAEGIQAWRQSDVYKLYIAMGHESLGSGKTIRDVAMSRQQQGEASLSEQEFSLIADLNKKLRF